MAKYNGRNLIVKIGDGGSPENFTTIAAMKTAKIDFTRNSVDVTNKDSNGWTENLNTASIASCQITGDGLFTEDSTQESIRAAFFSGISGNFQIKNGANEIFQGPFTVTAYSRSGGYNDAEALSFTLMSNGAVSHTAGS